MLDKLMRNVNNGIISDDFEFMMHEHDKNGDIVEITYKGVWLMVDNGCLNWSCTVSPAKDGSSYKVVYFSKWLEYMRKDVEYAFCVLKGRCFILRCSLRFERCIIAIKPV